MKKSNEFTSIIDKDRAIITILWRVVLLLSALLIILAIAFLRIKDTTMVTVELPSKVIYKQAPVVVAGINGSNKVYFRLWGNYIIEEVSSFEVNEFPKKILILEKMMRPSQFAFKEKEFSIFLQEIQQNLIAQKYEIIETIITNVVYNDDETISSATVVSDGISNQTVGKNKTKKECKYSIDLKYVKGVIYVENFGTNCF